VTSVAVFGGILEAEILTDKGQLVRTCLNNKHSTLFRNIEHPKAFKQAKLPLVESWAKTAN
jgi:hypothetical protein